MFLPLALLLSVATATAAGLVRHPVLPEPLAVCCRVRPFLVPLLAVLAVPEP